MTMTEEDFNRYKTLLAVREAVRSQNLALLEEACKTAWALAFIQGVDRGKERRGAYEIFSMAIRALSRKERGKAFQWTWDCYHPLMSDLGLALEHLDGFIRPDGHLTKNVAPSRKAPSN